MKTVLERLGELQLQVSTNTCSRGSSSYASYRTESDPETVEQKLRLAAAVSKATGRFRKVSLHAPGDIRTEEDASRVQTLLTELSLEAATFYPDLFTPRKNGVLNSRLMYGTLSSPYTDVRVASITFVTRAMDLMRAVGCRQMCLWIPDGIDSPGEKNLTDMLDRIMDGLRQIGLEIRKSENLMLEFRPYDPLFCSMAVSDWGTAAWLCRETDSSCRVLLDTAALLPGASLDSMIVAMLSMKVLGMVRLSDNRLSQGTLPAGTLDPASLFRFFLDLLLAEKAGLCSIPDMTFEVAVNARVGEPGECILRAVDNIEAAFASAMLVNPEELTELQSKPDAVLSEKLLRDAMLTDVRPILKAWREEKGLPADSLQALRSAKV